MTKPSDGGKGSAPRPFSVSNEEYAARWDSIFGRLTCQHCGKSTKFDAIHTCTPSRIDPYRKDEYDSGLDDVDRKDDE